MEPILKPTLQEEEVGKNNPPVAFWLWSLPD